MLEAKYGAKLEFFLEGGECKTERPSVGGLWILSGTANCAETVKKIN